MTWQPIETVPEGVEVLVFFPGPAYKDEHFSDERREVATTIAVCEVTRLGKHYSCAGYYDAINPSYEEPTHWMPLPTPPV